jgi:hypothetical protein
MDETEDLKETGRLRPKTQDPRPKTQDLKTKN